VLWIACAVIAITVPTVVFAAPALRHGGNQPRQPVAGRTTGPVAIGDGNEAAATGPASGVTTGGTHGAGSPGVRTFDIVTAGDILPHPSISRTAQTYGNGAYDFQPMFAALRPLVSHAALAICHLEIPLTDRPPSMDPTFTAPTQLAAAIAWTGWDACSTASNHTLDQHQDGVDSTLAALDRAGVKHAGSYRSAEDATRITMLDAQGVKIAFLAYTYGTNGIAPPSPWTVNMMSFDRIKADADKARAQGAGMVIVNLHWGTQYQHGPDAEQHALADRLLQGRVVDAIVGEHAHFVQPIARIDGRFVSYGQGNMLASQYPFGFAIDTLDGIVTVIHVRVAGGTPTIIGMDYVPTFIERPAFRVVPVGAELARLRASGQGASLLAGQLGESYERTVAAVGRGPLTHPIPASLP
jgi:poly-gamma-glutamate synthesis protein (capsule biosynthesis protein)